MRKRVRGKKLGRGQGSRKALYRSLVRALVLEGKIVTTKAKAEVVRREMGKIMKWVGDGSVAARRKVVAGLGNDRETAQKLFSQYQSVAGERKSGFLKLTKLSPRMGDNAEIVRIEWVKTKTEKK